jgi:hypothetical protein
MATGAANEFHYQDMTEASSAVVGAGLPKVRGCGNLKAVVPCYFCLQTNSRAISAKFPSAGAPN